MITLYAEQITNRLNEKSIAYDHYRKYRKEMNQHIQRYENTQHGDTHVIHCEREFMKKDPDFLVNFPFKAKVGFDAKRYFTALGFKVRYDTLSDDTAFAYFPENWFDRDNSTRLDTKQIITRLVKGALAFHIYSKNVESFSTALLKAETPNIVSAHPATLASIAKGYTSSAKHGIAYSYPIKFEDNQWLFNLHKTINNVEDVQRLFETLGFDVSLSNTAIDLNGFH